MLISLTSVYPDLRWRFMTLDVEENIDWTWILSTHTDFYCTHSSTDRWYPQPVSLFLLPLQSHFFWVTENINNFSSVIWPHDDHKSPLIRRKEERMEKDVTNLGRARFTVIMIGKRAQRINTTSRRKKVLFSIQQWWFYAYAQSVTVLSRVIEKKEAAISLFRFNENEPHRIFNTVRSVRWRATTRVKIVRWAQSDAQPWYTVDRGKFRKLVLLNDGVWLCARDASRFTVVSFPLRQLSRNPFSCTRRGS